MPHPTLRRRGDARSKAGRSYGGGSTATGDWVKAASSAAGVGTAWGGASIITSVDATGAGASVSGAGVGGSADSGGASGKVASVLKPSNTCAHRPHRTMPCCACNCGGVTRKVVAQLGHWVTMLMTIARYRLLPLISTHPS